MAFVLYITIGRGLQQTRSKMLIAYNKKFTVSALWQKHRIMDMSYTQDVYMSHRTEYDTIYQIYWNESTLYNFRTSNSVQQRKNEYYKSCKGSTQLLFCYNCYIIRYKI
jgi:hypothetical protein